MSKYTIVVVDDDEKVLNALTRCLMDEKYTILTVRDGEAGLTLLEKRDVDLVISDHRMPGMTGLEFLKRVRADHPDVVTMLITAYGDVNLAELAINEAGIYKFISKPWNEAYLKSSVGKALALRQVEKERDLFHDRVLAKAAQLRGLD